MIEKKLLKLAEYITTLTGINCNVFDVQGKKFLDGSPKECDNCCKNDSTHLYGTYEAQRWGGEYIYYCPKGLAFIACAISDHSLIVGPFTMSEDEEVNVPFIETTKVTALSKIVLLALLSLDQKPEEDDRFNIMYEISSEIDKYGIASYPYESERQLQQLILTGDKEGARELLNKLLGQLYFYSGTDINIIKSRVTELLVLLSRAAIDGGADMSQIFFLNETYINQINNFNNIDELSRWLTGVMHKFTSYVFDFPLIRCTDAVYKAIEYVKKHYSEKISLDSVADAVYMSRSHLSRQFAKETGKNFTAFINELRIKKAKEMLHGNIPISDIALKCGFEDQSYFTKVFKSITGVSPGKFRGIK